MPDLTPAERLHAFAAQVENDPDLDDDDRVAIHDAAVGMAQRIQRLKALRDTAHIHEVKHIFNEDPAKDSFRCHDCRRALVSDAGTERLLVCPQVHGFFAGSMRPKNPDGAVECGMKE